MGKCDLCDLKENNPTFIHSFPYWTLLANYMQPTLGSVLLVLNRHSEDLSDLCSLEEKSYFDAVKSIERSLRESFNPDMINHLMLANVVRHTHYHIVPRYEKSRDFKGHNFVDETYGHMPKLTQERKSPEIIEVVKGEILANLF